MEYPDDDGVRSVNLPPGNLKQVFGHITGPGGEYELGVQDIGAFVSYLSNLIGLPSGKLDQLLARIAVVEGATGVGNGGTELNARITELAELVASKASSQALSNAVSALGEADGDLDDKIDELATSIRNDIKVISDRYADFIGGSPDRPGDGPGMFTSEMVGNPALRAPIERGTVEDGGELGRVLRISGSDIDPNIGYLNCAPRRVYYMQKERAYLLQFAHARFADPIDPQNHAVELRLQTLDSDYRQVRDVALVRLAPKKSEGPRFNDMFVGKNGAPGSILYTIPDRASYGVPYFRIYGNGHLTDLGSVRILDVTFALAGGADIATIIKQIVAIDKLMETRIAIEDVREITDVIEDEIEQLRLSQQSGTVTRKTYAELLDLTLLPDATYSVPFEEDAGTHAGIASEAGYSNGRVPNSGLFAAIGPEGGPYTLRRVGSAPSLAAEISRAEIYATPVAGDQFTLRRESDGKVVRLTLEDFGVYMNGPPTFIYPAHAEIGAESQIVIPNDPGLKEVSIINTGGGKAYLRDGGFPAVVDGNGTVPVEPGGGLWATDMLIPGAVSAAAEAPTKLSIRFRSTSTFNVAARAAAQDYVDRIVSRNVALNLPEEAALRDYYGKLYVAGALEALGCIYNLQAPNAVKWMNLCNIKGIFAKDHDQVGLTRVNWRNVTFDGASGWVDTNLRLDRIAAINDYTLLAHPADGTVQGSSRVAIGDGNTTLIPNRSSGSLGYRDGSNEFLSVAGFAAGDGLVSMTRDNPETLTFRQRKGSPLVVPDPVSVAFSTRTLLIGARNAGEAGGEAVPDANSFLLGPYKMFGAGHHVSEEMHNAISDANNELTLAAEAFS